VFLALMMMNGDEDYDADHFETCLWTRPPCGACVTSEYVNLTQDHRDGQVSWSALPTGPLTQELDGG
jgi:hypothetical protein